MNSSLKKYHESECESESYMAGTSPSPSPQKVDSSPDSDSSLLNFVNRSYNNLGEKVMRPAYSLVSDKVARDSK